MLEWKVEHDRRIDATGLPSAVLPEWGGTLHASATTFILHPPIDFEIAYRVDRYVAFLPFGSAATELSVGDTPMRRTRLRAGTIIFVEPGTCVRARQVEPVEFLVLSIDPSRVETLGESWAAGRPWRAQTITDLADPGIASLAVEIRRSLLSDHFTQAAYLQALADALIVRLLCHFLGELDEAAPGEALPPGRLARIVSHIDANLDGVLRVSDLAAMAGLTRSHFSRAFQRATGDPPQRYILKRRVCRARDLLSSGGASIAEVAIRAGFSSQAHLSTAFKDEVGTTPGRYRTAFSGST